MVDARGFSCPIPVVMVQEEVKKNHPESFQVMVDQRVAVENISRYAASQNYAVQVENQGEEFCLTLTQKN